jgi:hypothetical protein
LQHRDRPPGLAPICWNTSSRFLSQLRILNGEAVHLIHKGGHIFSEFLETTYSNLLLRTIWETDHCKRKRLNNFCRRAYIVVMRIRFALPLLLTCVLLATAAQHAVTRNSVEPSSYPARISLSMGTSKEIPIRQWPSSPCTFCFAWSV